MTTCLPLMGRNVTSCNVVRPRPSPLDIHARNRRRVMTAGACVVCPAACGATKKDAAPAAAAVIPFSRSFRRVNRLRVVLIRPSSRSAKYQGIRGRGYEFWGARSPLLARRGGFAVEKKVAKQLQRRRRGGGSNSIIIKWMLRNIS